ncbi:MAG: BatA domain-containing protein [Acidobacteria bacterium]|nr:BatA domain-containing protein [Acidobacteriota bacterium]
MNLVNPFFLLGTLAASVPILLHLMKRSQSRRMEYPSLMFLRKISKRYIRMQKLRHLLLLLLRILALVLLALAFARPYLEVHRTAAASGAGSTTHIILLDNSLSMGYGDRWARARSEAARIARNVEPGDKIALLEFSDRTLVAVPLADDPAPVLARIERGVELSDRPTLYAQALKAAERVALDVPAARRTVHLISDFQRSGIGVNEQMFRLGGGIELQATDLGDDTFANFAIADVQILEDGGSESGSMRVKASVLCLGDEERPAVPVSLELGGRKTGEKTLDPAGG